MTDTDIHSCGYYCDRPACIKAQRNELRDKLFGEQWVKTYSGGKPNYTEPCERCGEVNPAEIHTCTPKQREWQWLTKEEIIRLRHLYDPTAHWSLDMFARAIEAKIREKNA